MKNKHLNLEERNIIEKLIRDNKTKSKIVQINMKKWHYIVTNID